MFGFQSPSMEGHASKCSMTDLQHCEECAKWPNFLRVKQTRGVYNTLRFLMPELKYDNKYEYLRIL